MTLPVVIYVVWYPETGYDEKNKKLAEAITTHFDTGDDAQDALGSRTPVRVRSDTWDGSGGGPPRPIDFTAAQLNAVVVLSSSELVDAFKGNWRAFIETLAAERATRPDRTLVLSFRAPDIKRLPGFEAVQHVSTDDWPGTAAEEPWRVRLLLFIVNFIGRHLKAVAKVRLDGGDIDAAIIDRERLFLSHARADGDDVARAIEKHLALNRYRVETFVDVTDLPAGTRFEPQFDAEIARSAMVVIRTDRYASRPWCRWEVLRGKHHRRPLLIVDVGERGEPRIFPYAGNVPSIRAAAVRPAGSTKLVVECHEIERIVLAMMSEVLRMLLWQTRAEVLVQRAKEAGHRDVVRRRIVYLPRVPELVDVAQLRIAILRSLTVVYPDPPLDQHEKPLIAAVSGTMRFLALSELEVA